jgi:hypothetical protein
MAHECIGCQERPVWEYQCSNSHSVLCFHCLGRWKDEAGTCPICRTDISNAPGIHETWGNLLRIGENCDEKDEDLTNTANEALELFAEYLREQILEELVLNFMLFLVDDELHNVDSLDRSTESGDEVNIRIIEIPRDLIVFDENADIGGALD